MTPERIRLTPRDIILEIGRNMHASCVPLISKVIVPSSYEVFLHQDDFHVHEPMFRLMREEAAVHLTAELERLNSGNSGIPALLRTVVGRKNPNLPYYRDGSEWTVLFSIDPNSEMPRGAVLVSSQMQMPETTTGAKTRRVLTERFNDNPRLFDDETVETRSVRTSAAAGDPRPALAYLYYRSQNGETRQFPMDRPEVSIGRGGDHKWVDLQISSAPSISKEHLLIRYNAEERGFEAQDVSTNGTRLDGKLLAPKTWTKLGSSASFELAADVSIEFKAAR